MVTDSEIRLLAQELNLLLTTAICQLTDAELENVAPTLTAVAHESHARTGSHTTRNKNAARHFLLAAVDEQAPEEYKLVLKAFWGIDNAASVNAAVRAANAASLLNRKPNSVRKGKFRIRLVGYMLDAVIDKINNQNVVPPLPEPTHIVDVLRSTILSSRGVIDTLNDLYPSHKLVTLWGVDMPITVFAAHESDPTNLEAPRGELKNRNIPALDDYADEFDEKYGKPAFLEYVERYRSSTPKERQRFFSDPTYAFEGLREVSPGHYEIDVVMGRYFTSLATSEDLDTELMSALANNPHEPVKLGELPRRHWVHRHSAQNDPVMDGRHRAAAVSHGTVVMLASETDPDGWNIVLPRRSADVATHAYFNHIAPSGIFAPFSHETPSQESDYSVRTNFFREWAEEIYGVIRHHRPGNELFLPDPADEPLVGRLKKLLDSPLGDLYYTGISVNLLTLRPEICLLLVVRDPQWARKESKKTLKKDKRAMRFGWEYVRGSIDDELHLGQPRDWPFAIDENLEPVTKKPLRPEFLTPNAAGAISLALSFIREHDSEPLKRAQAPHGNAGQAPELS